MYTSERSLRKSGDVLDSMYTFKPAAVLKHGVKGVRVHPPGGGWERKKHSPSPSIGFLLTFLIS